MTQKPTESSWEKVGERAYVLTLPAFKANIGLVIGDERAVVIDTGAGPGEAETIHAAIREVTDLPLVVVNTHAHADHYFGNAYFAAHGVKDVWAHSAAAEAMESAGEKQRPLVADSEPAMAAADGSWTELRLPNKTVADEPVDLDLGGYTVTLFHLGRGHTSGDLLVGSGNVLFAGDLVEEGAHPEFEDSYPYEWRKTLGKIIAIDELYSVVVPGHGRVVDPDYVRSQLNNLRQAIRMCNTAIHEASVDYTKAVPVLPYGPTQSRHLILRLKATETTADQILPH
ncbi:MBL fold metallo-hydrolase [Zhihengliuella salsuginis]|uniref:MBL fold metallo-hydrolase n=1 Tax=Zhihengliuella salsuginis TaxID=578222 RepID=A0ABQ3GJ88_9MICC|nr:MBL fold metallo-hydrolase [Zhihengliuella salsuginis]GHD10278.1 MBL fold metallo-hydrolase [Zhihengliuella salsuginis]